MISLHELQRDFLCFALGDDGAAGREWIVENGLSAERRLGVYRNNAQIGFAKAMQATFPVLVRLSGEDWFNQTALCYQRTHPSRSGDLNTIGSKFTEFLAETLRGGDYEYFIDVARLEWAYGEALNKREAGPANFVGLDVLTDEDYRYLRLLVNPTVHLVASEFPLFNIWNSNRDGSESPAVIHLNQGASQILLIRRREHVEVRELSPQTFALLRAFAEGATVHEGVDSVIDTLGQFDLTDALGRLIGLGALIGFRLAFDGEPRVI